MSAPIDGTALFAALDRAREDLGFDAVVSVEAVAGRKRHISVWRVGLASPGEMCWSVSGQGPTFPVALAVAKKRLRRHSPSPSPNKGSSSPGSRGTSEAPSEQSPAGGMDARSGRSNGATSGGVDSLRSQQNAELFQQPIPSSGSGEKAAERKPSQTAADRQSRAIDEHRAKGRR